MTEHQDGYNGWSNYETWLVATWLDNEQETYHLWRDHAKDAVINALDENADLRHTKAELVLQAITMLSQQLSTWLEEQNPLQGQANVFCDLLNAALSEVNEWEVAQHYLEDDLVNDAVQAWLNDNSDEVQ